MAGKPKHFTADARDKVASLLAALPEKPKAERGLAAKDIIASLKAEIKAAQSKGYTIEEIVKSFKDGGVEIGLTTLKTALKQPRQPAKKKSSVASDDGKKGSVYTDQNSSTETGESQVKGQEQAAQDARRVITQEDKQALRAEAENTLTPAASKRGVR